MGGLQKERKNGNPAGHAVTSELARLRLRARAADQPTHGEATRPTWDLTWSALVGGVVLLRRKTRAAHGGIFLFSCPVIDATWIPWRFLDYFTYFRAGIFGIFAQNLPLWSLRPSLTVGMTKIPKILGLFRYLFFLLESGNSR